MQKDRHASRDKQTGGSAKLSSKLITSQESVKMKPKVVNK